MTTKQIVGYNVYRAEEGSSLEYYGHVETLEEARALAAKGNRLAASDWGTAEAAGHVCGISAPDRSGELEDGEPVAWFGADGYDCAVPVYEVGPYTLQMRDEGGADESETFAARPSLDEIESWIDSWCADGEWGDEGAEVRCWWSLCDATGAELDKGSHSVEIEPCHESLIRAATDGHETCGDDPEDHDWTSEGEGGLDENPGVWSTGGTSMTFASHCRVCGLHRTERSTGSQRNPEEHDTVKYRMLDSYEIARHRKNGSMVE